MKAGLYIISHTNFSVNESDVSLTNGDDYYSIRKNTVQSLLDKGLVYVAETRSTVMPDTETLIIKIKR